MAFNHSPKFECLVVEFMIIKTKEKKLLHMVMPKFLNIYNLKLCNFVHMDCWFCLLP